MLLIYTGR